MKKFLIMLTFCCGIVSPSAAWDESKPGNWENRPDTWEGDPSTRDADMDKIIAGILNSKNTKKITELTETMAKILDEKSESYCKARAWSGSNRAMLHIFQREINCMDASGTVWAISADDLINSQFALISIGGVGYLVYKPLLNGAQNLGDLYAKKAVVSKEELEEANDKVALKQGKKAIENLRNQIEQRITNNNLF